MHLYKVLKEQRMVLQIKEPPRAEQEFVAVQAESIADAERMGGIVIFMID